MTTNLNTTSCPIPDDALVCAFSVQSVVCDSIIGKLSNPEVVRLQGMRIM